MNNSTGTRPEKRDYAEYYDGYVSLVGEGDVVEILKTQIAGNISTLKGISAEQSLFRYQEDKWSIKEVLGHLIDTERVMAFRALAFARGDTYEIPGMDQDQYVKEGDYDRCEFTALLDEFMALRESTVHFFQNLNSDCWNRGGLASGHHVKVRALAYIIAGHELHHMIVLKNRYLDGMAHRS